MIHRTADVLIVGGGVVGMSAAYHLKRDGADGRVVVVERDRTYRRASSYLAMGGIRQQFGSALNVRMAQFSIAFYERFDERLAELGREPTRFSQRGYLFLANQATADRFRRRFERQQALGARVEWLDRDALAGRLPGVRLDDIEFGVIGPPDGYANPRAVLAGLRAAAAAEGAEILDDEVVGIHQAEGRVTGVELASYGRLSTTAVVNAAGAYAARVAALAGLDLPVQPVRQHLFRAELPARWPYRFPMVIDPGGVHWRHDDLVDPDAPTDRIVVAKTRLDEPPGENFACDESRWARDFLPDLVNRVPSFANLTLVEGWAGLYEMTPDHNPVIGEHPALNGFFLANGFSGHGLMLSPATGKIVSELVRTGSSSTFDIRPFAVDRFERGELFWDEAMV
jgi:glycine/D-amino acid oxidase-like deaminating enzyme